MLKLNSLTTRRSASFPFLIVLIVMIGIAVSKSGTVAQSCATTNLGALTIGYDRSFDGEIVSDDSDCWGDDIGLHTRHGRIDVYDFTSRSSTPASGVSALLRVEVSSTVHPRIFLFSRTGELLQQVWSPRSQPTRSSFDDREPHPHPEGAETVTMDATVHSEAPYRLVVTTHHFGDYRVRIRYGSPSSLREVEREIVERYAPWLFFHRGDGASGSEQFFPVSILAMIHHAWLFEYSDDDPNCPSFDPQYDCDDPLLLSRASPHLHGGLSADTYLDIRTDGPNGTELDHETWWSTVGGRYKEPVIYARVTELDGGGISVQYWFFYVFNDAPGDPTNYWDHEGDWESIQLAFDQPLDTVRRGVAPSEVAYAAHKGGAVGASSCAKWVGLHPVVYVARGSHASYFNRPWSGTRSADRYDGAGKSLQPGQYRIEIIDDSDVWRWRGQWGDRLGGQTDGPTGPLQQSHSWLSPSALVTEAGWSQRHCDVSSSIDDSLSAGVRTGVPNVWLGAESISASSLIDQLDDVRAVRLRQRVSQSVRWLFYGMEGSRIIPGSEDFEIQPGDTLWLAD